ncbi:MAG: GntR family transcriptional regulator [Verrucomicrobia bacterium]|nr:GntR family transcriptional regulator [Verrucomicrobiota bacterium]
MDKRFRKAAKQERIVTALRREIIRGVCPSASQIPSHLVLARRFRVSPVTIQRAMDCLAKEGFIRTEQRCGMFVVARPPHLSHYALVFAEDPANARLWSRFYAALLNESEVIQNEDGCCILPFYGINGHTDSKDYQRLLELVLADRLAGLIFVQGEHYVAGTPLMTRDGIARVALKSRPLFPRVPVVTLDLGAFMRRTLDYFVAHNRRRVAMIATPPKPEHPQDFEHFFHGEMPKRKLTTRPYWTLQISAQAAVGARNCVRLLMESNPRDRPNALIIADDNLVEDVVAGLLMAGVRVPDELEIVAHCNFPWAGLQAMPLRWLGFDISQVLSACLDAINRQRRGEAVPPQTMLEPMFEEELAGKMPNSDLSPVALAKGECRVPNLKPTCSVIGNQ